MLDSTIAGFLPQHRRDARSVTDRAYRARIHGFTRDDAAHAGRGSRFWYRVSRETSPIGRFVSVGAWKDLGRARYGLRQRCGFGFGCIPIPPNGADGAKLPLAG
jgi:hypothetical protein